MIMAILPGTARTQAIDKNQLESWLAAERDAIVDRLAEFIAFDTVTPGEDRCIPWLTDTLERHGFEVRREHIHPEITRHPSYTNHPLTRLGPERFNLRARKRSQGENAPSVLFNGHIDVVPTTPDFARPFSARVEDGRIYGRGACDTKNNILMLLEAIRFLEASGVGLGKNVDADFVIEEEIGGNGTLSTILHGVEAQEVIMLEPTDSRVYCGHRGCLSFEVAVRGRAVHMGGDDTGISAIERTFDVIRVLKELEKRLLAEARDDPDFKQWSRPVQINVGVIEGGEWSGSVPENCRIWCDLGFLPRYSLEDAGRLIREAIDSIPDPWTKTHSDVRFGGLRNDAYIIPNEAPLVRDLLGAAQRCGSDQSVSYGWKVSCDARLYNRLLGLPTVVFGSGSLNDAHSSHENVEIDELLRGIATLVEYLAPAKAAR
jgi:acetylornithine deacetylase